MIYYLGYNLKQINVSNGELNLCVDSLGRDNYNIVKSSDENQDSEFKLELQDVTLKSMQVCYLNEITSRIQINFQDVRLTGELSTDELNAYIWSNSLKQCKELRSDIGKESRNRLQFKLNVIKTSYEIANSSNSNRRTRLRLMAN